MVNYKKSLSAVAISATLVAAQNTGNNGTVQGGNNISNNDNTNVATDNSVTINNNQTNSGNGTQVNVNNYNFDYTTVIPGLAPTGWADHTYTFHQICPTPCGKPNIPLGWDWHTTQCDVGCGPKPTIVKVLAAPWGPSACEGCDNSPPPPPPHHDDHPSAPCPTCHVAEVEYCPPIPADCEDESCMPPPVTYATTISTPVICPPPASTQAECTECEQAAQPSAPAPCPTCPGGSNSSPQMPSGGSNSSPQMPSGGSNSSPQMPSGGSNSSPQQPGNSGSSPQQPGNSGSSPSGNSGASPQQPAGNSGSSPSGSSPSGNNGKSPSAPSGEECNGDCPPVGPLSSANSLGVASVLMAAGIAVAALL